MSTTKVSAAMQDTMVVADLPAGSVVQVVNTQVTAMSTGTTVIPTDTSVPQNTEGDEYMTLAITPSDASNILYVEWVIAMFGVSAAGPCYSCLFQDATAGALATVAQQIVGADHTAHMVGRYRMVAGTASSTTFKIRCGHSNAATFTFNGDGGAATHGVSTVSSITITEIAV